ncbi:hypothetical protein AMATHDRAFT_139905 [Amanita thiersii Skay4041]|uniref:Histone acetyltransferase type B catalytic subunit n=1 Tax=Amanita thiersii Skay4041 TaxID=703135 RepID=A0A2A9NVX6_9AGAR|nr:hypothetical protein AMATHDRAFT_139905 [Amanita thiersii Skay4041]
MADWTADSNQALSLSFVRSTADSQVLAEGESYSNFHPAFTYPLYGEDETIYGYKDLAIDLRFSSGSLVQYLNVKYSEKLPSTTVDDVEGILADFIPPGFLRDEATFLQQVETDAESFRPHGELVDSYTRPSPQAISRSKGKSTGIGIGELKSEDTIEYEVYHSTWDTPGFKEYHRRLQLLVLLYIEGGSYINDDEDSWEFMVLYEKRKRKAPSAISTYHLVGYSSLYNFYHFPEKVRMRLSQFIIIPPYQRHGHGSELFQAIYRHVLSRSDIAELTVEDPAEAFEDLRDKNDLHMLTSNQKFMEEAFGSQAVSHGGGRVGGIGRAGRSGRGGNGTSRTAGKLGPPVDKTWAEKWRRDLKIAGRQFQRLIEMLMLSRLNLSNPRIFKAYRLQVKERLYRFNYEVLVQLDKTERLEKLEETFQSVQNDYHRILKFAGCI